MVVGGCRGVVGGFRSFHVLVLAANHVLTSALVRSNCQNPV